MKFLIEKKKKKWDKKLSITPFIKHDAGNVEKGTAIFNSAMNTGSPALGGQGMGENYSQEEENIMQEDLKKYILIHNYGGSEHGTDTFIYDDLETAKQELKSEYERIREDYEEGNYAPINEEECYINDDLMHAYLETEDDIDYDFAWDELMIQETKDGRKEMKENLDNITEVEEKSKEVVDPVYADAVRDIEKNNEKHDEVTKMRKAPKEGEESLPKDLKFELKESLFEDYDEEDNLEELSKYRLIWDDCSATAERRPTTEYDIEEDIHVKDYISKEQLLEDLMDLADIDEEAFEEEEITDFDEKINYCLSYFDDPGDGSPNILYVNIDGNDDYDYLTYDELEDMDLATCTEDCVRQALIDGIDWDEDLDESIDLKEANYDNNYKKIISALEREIETKLPDHDCIAASDYKSINIDGDTYRLDIKTIPLYSWIGRHGDVEFQSTDEAELINAIAKLVAEDLLANNDAKKD